MEKKQIYDSDEVIRLLILHRQSKTSYMKELIELHVSLAEVIASKFPAQHRDDLIQEMLKQVPYILGKFDISRHPHKYMTTAFTNTCRSYVSSKRLQREVPLEYEDKEEEIQDIVHEKTHLIALAIEHNRKRFPSLPVDKIDKATSVCISMMYGETEKQRGVIKAISTKCKLNRHEATIVYYVTIIFLRKLYEKTTPLELIIDEKEIEFTLLPEVRDTIGEQLFEDMLVTFAGFSIKVPS